jgi:hypothetical protein
MGKTYPRRTAGRGRMSGVTSLISHTTVDCANAYELSEWWKQVLGYVDLDDDPNEPGHEECMIVSPHTGHRLLFIEVPDEKRVKNRIHFDIQPHTGSRDQEVDRVVALGATEIDDQRNHYGPGIGWVVLQDPEGNEFCILRSDEERAAHPMQPT